MGAKTFRDDRDIQGGDDIPDAIRDAILAANEMVVLLSPASVSRPWVLMEIGAAWLRGADMRIVGIRQHVEVELIPAMVKSKKVIDLNHFDQYLLELAGRVSHRAYVRFVVWVSLLDRRAWVAAGEPLGLGLSEIDLLTRCIAALVGNKAAQAPPGVRCERHSDVREPDTRNVIAVGIRCRH